MGGRRVEFVNQVVMIGANLIAALCIDERDDDDEGPVNEANLHYIN